MKLLILWIALHSKKPIVNFQPEIQPKSPICFCVWKIDKEPLFIRKEISCTSAGDYVDCVFLDGVIIVNK